MNIEFLGTGAADWTPVCREDYTPYRRYSSALIDGELLIDPGPHIFDYLEKTGQPELFDGLKYILITHSHADHYCFEVAKTLCERYGCAVWGYPTVNYRITDPDAHHQADAALRFSPVRGGEAFSLGEYAVIPLPGNHGADNPTGETVLNYLIERNGKRLFYGLDSAWMTERAWSVLRNKPAALYVLDCTVGFHDDDWRIFSHSGVTMCRLMRDCFVKNRYCTDGARFVLSHFARTLVPGQTELEARLSGTGLLAAYDGMILKI